MTSTAKVSGPEWLRGDEQPFTGTATVDIRTWEDVALEDGKRFASRLQDMGLPDPVIQQALGVRDTAEKEVSDAVATFWRNHPRRYIETPPDVRKEVSEVYDSARRSAWDRLRDWWARRVTQVESKEARQVMLPLFLLSAPMGAGCSTEFTTEGSDGGKLGWSLAVGGTGLGGEAKITVSTSFTFEAQGGQRKVIFLPLMVALETVVLTEPGTAPVRFRRIDIAGLRDQHPAPGTLLLADNASPPVGSFVETYPLASDPSGTTAAYEYTYEQASTANLKVGLSYQGVDLGLTSEATMTSKVGLKFKLRSGRDYRLYRTRDGDGLLWDPPVS